MERLFPRLESDKKVDGDDNFGFVDEETPEELLEYLWLTDTLNLEIASQKVATGVRTSCLTTILRVFTRP